MVLERGRRVAGEEETDMHGKVIMICITSGVGRMIPDMELFKPVPCERTDVSACWVIRMAHLRLNIWAGMHRTEERVVLRVCNNIHVRIYRASGNPDAAP
jgi:hypothetical protein